MEDEFDDSHEQLLKDINYFLDLQTGTTIWRSVLKNEIMGWLKREAMITRVTESRAWRMAATGPIYELRQELDRAKARIAELEEVLDDDLR